MSGFEVTQLVIDHSKARGIAKLVLVAIARHSDEKGIAWPGIETLAMIVGKSERQAQRYVGELRTEFGDEISLVERGRWRCSNLYKINLAEFAKRRLEAEKNKSRKGNITTPMSSYKTVATNFASHDDKHDRHHDKDDGHMTTPASPEQNRNKTNKQTKYHSGFFEKEEGERKEDPATKRFLAEFEKRKGRKLGCKVNAPTAIALASQPGVKENDELESESVSIKRGSFLGLVRSAGCSSPCRFVDETRRHCTTGRGAEAR